MGQIPKIKVKTPKRISFFKRTDHCLSCIKYPNTGKPIITRAKCPFVEKAMAAANVPNTIGRQCGAFKNAKNCHKDKATKPVSTASVLKSIPDKTIVWALKKISVAALAIGVEYNN